MNTIDTQASIRGAVALILSGALACAQAQLAAPYVGGALGDSDLGTGIRAFGGAAITGVFGWEAQLTSFGSQTVRPLTNSSCRTSAWALGGGGTAKVPLSPVISVYGKAGAHYVKAGYSGNCTNPNGGDIELGVGAGMLWHFSPKAALRVEFESIGGVGGDFISVGVQFPL
ncbi:MAG: outer membrane beta-barrel protein [Burkholderiaceae bacterium]